MVEYEEPVLWPTEGTEVRLMYWHMLYLEALRCTGLPPPHIDTLLAFCTLLLSIWIFQVFLESLKIHRSRPRSNLSEVGNSPKRPWFVKIIEKFFLGRSTIGALVGRPDTLWSVVQAPYGRSTTDLMVGRPSDFWMKWAKNWVVGQWFFAQKGQNVQFWFSRLQVEVAKTQLSFW